MRYVRHLLAPIAVVALLASCERSTTPAQPSGSEPTAATPDVGPAGAAWVLAAEPADVKSVVEVKAAAAEGDRVVVRGRIGGRRDPLTAGSPVFTVMDLSVPHCGENPEDKCATPWDYCCETPDTKKANAATVQIVGTDGQPISGDAASGGLKPLDEVVLVGTVGPRPTPDVLTILASGVYRVGH
jgi:hypothetical protein